jgi:glycosyltransferase involved in cell wall biosynthesis
MIHYMTIQGVGDAWVGNELRVVQGDGIPVVLHALRRPQKTFFNSDDIMVLDQDTRAIYPLSKASALGALLAAPSRFGGRFWRALGSALFGPRENSRIRVRGLWHLAVACRWAAGLRDDPVPHIHSQWAHAGASVAMYGATLLGTSFSFTGHAADLFRERAALRAKIDAAAFIVCISEFHRQFYISQGADPAKLFVAYCGIDTSHFSPVLRDRPEGAPVRILSSGRLVEKKGFDVLIDALALLRDRALPFEAVIAGSGPLEAALRAQITARDLDAHVTLTGEALKQEDIPTFMASGDIYTLPCQRAPDGDIDGLPQMLMEAMACGLPAVSTDLVGIPDLIHDGATGLLIAPEDAPALADALTRLAEDTDLAKRLATAGRAHVLEHFDLSVCLEPLLARYRSILERES